MTKIFGQVIFLNKLGDDHSSNQGLKGLYLHTSKTYAYTNGRVKVVMKDLHIIQQLTDFL